MHPNRHFPGHFVVHMPSYLHVFFRVVRPLHQRTPMPMPSCQCTPPHAKALHKPMPSSQPHLVPVMPMDNVQSGVAS